MKETKGRFGIHGGQYIPETLMNAVIELENAYNHYKNDPEFNKELNCLLNDYAGRPSKLYFAKKMTADLGGAKIYLKREDLTHTGAHKINNVLGELVEYTKVHFADEEDYMEKINYEGLEDQKRAHSMFVEKIENINLDDVDDNQDEYLTEILNFLLDWLVNHILKADKLIPVVELK